VSTSSKVFVFKIWVYIPRIERKKHLTEVSLLYSSSFKIFVKKKQQKCSHGKNFIGKKYTYFMAISSHKINFTTEN
jgi:hypothetical protein